MPRGSSSKRERQYEHIKDSAKQRGQSTGRAEEIAARTVNKERARSGEAKSASKSSTKDMPSSRRGGLRSHRGAGGATKDQPFWLVLGQSDNSGWTASVDGHDIGRPQLVDGYANGWLINPAAGDVKISLRWTPQRNVWIALGLRIFGIAAISSTLANSFMPITVVFSRSRLLRSATILARSNGSGGVCCCMAFSRMIVAPILA